MTLLDLCKLLKRNILLVIGLPILCALICGIVVHMQPSSFEAKASIATESSPVQIGNTATKAASAASVDGVTVTAATNTSSKTITFTAESSSSQAAINAVNSALNTTVIRTVKDQLEAESSSAQSGATNTATNTSATIAPSTDTANSTSTGSAMQITRAKTATDTSPSTVKYAAIAFLAGLFIAICIVVIIDMARGTMHSSRDIEEDYETKLLGRIPGCGKKKDAPGVSENSRESLLANIRFAVGDRKSVCLVGVGCADLATNACTEIARAASAALAKVLVIDADLRGQSDLRDQLAPGMESDATGLTSVLAKDVTIESVAEEIEDNIWFVPAGVQVNSPVALLDSPYFDELLNEAQGKFDLIILNTTSPEKHADFTYVAHAAGGTVLCLQEFESKRKDIEDVASQLIIAKANVIGFVAAAAK